MHQAQLIKSSQTALKGMITRQHHFDLPLDYANKSDGRLISVFAREIAAPEHDQNKDLPWLLYLNGGPGFQCERPETASGWLKRALKDYRVLLLDQRGTGLSSPATFETLGSLGEAVAQAEYLRCFRADSIVADCESIRESLAGGKQWTVLGQSFGGFCITHYLSKAPDGLNGAILCGGLAPLSNNPDELYRAIYKRVVRRNQIYYERFPEDVETVAAIVRKLKDNQTRLPNGEILTPRRFLSVGINFGFDSAGQTMTSTHYAIERAFLPQPAGSGREKQLSYAFLHEVEQMCAFNTNPIYAILHEAIYCQGSASRWSAERLLSEYPEFSLDEKPVLFTGEMIYPWMFDQYTCLRPLKEAAQLLADYESWPPLYDLKQLRANRVPCVASVYVDDLYVDFDFSRATADNINGIKLWITNEYEHDGIRVDGENLLDRLLTMLKDAR